MSLPLLAISALETSVAPKRILPFDKLKEKKRRVELEGLDPLERSNVGPVNAARFRAAFANLNDFEGEVVVEREITYNNYEDAVVNHETISVSWDFPDEQDSRIMRWKRNFGIALDARFDGRPSIEMVQLSDGTYGKPAVEFRYELYTPQQWYDAFGEMAWDVYIESIPEEGVERAIVRRP